MLALTLAVLLHLFGHDGPARALLLENLALRQQLSTLRLGQRRPRLRLRDRLFWTWLASRWPGWKHALVIVKPETVVGWHRQGWRLYWRWRSRPRGRPPKEREIRDLVRQMASENPTWGAPRIHGELLKLGYRLSERTVSRLMPPREPGQGGSGQSWATFLKNHARHAIAVDFFAVPTALFRVLYVFVVIDLERRRILHFNVTAHPHQHWAAQQIVETVAWEAEVRPQFLLRDRDAIYGTYFRRRVTNLGIQEQIIAYRSPWQNGRVERLIGSIRREFLDHVIVLDERHLCRLLREYVDYYNRSRTHLALRKDAPISRNWQAPHEGKVVSTPLVGGLHHRYERRAA